MRAASLLALGATLLATACGPVNPGPSGELASVLAFGAYPGGTPVGEWFATEGGPVPMPGNFGWREVRTADEPAKVRAHYEQLARGHGWTFVAVQAGLPFGQSPVQVAELVYKARTLRVWVGTTPSGGPGMGAWGPVPKPAVESSQPSPSPGATPTPTPTLPPGPWYVRLEGQVGYR